MDLTSPILYFSFNKRHLFILYGPILHRAFGVDKVLLFGRIYTELNASMVLKAAVSKLKVNCSVFTLYGFRTQKASFDACNALF